MTRMDVVAPEHRVEGQWPQEGLERLGRCPVCGSGSRVLLYEGLRDRIFFCASGDWTLYQCVDCRSGYLDPRPTPATIGLAYAQYFTHHPSERPAVEAMTVARRWQRALANGYRNWRYGTRDRPSSALGIPFLWALPRMRALLDSELRHLPRTQPGTRVLDVGFGDGAFLRWAAAAGWDAIGVDPDPLAVEAARRRGLDVRCGTVDLVTEEPSSFDVVTLSHVIEHVHDPRALLDRIRVLLKVGGLLWIDTPNLSSVGHRAFGRDWIGLDPPRHLVLFNTGTLQRLLESAGFAIERRISRFEVCQRTYAASSRIAASHRNPVADAPVARSLRFQAWRASWRVRLQPEVSEFITLMATRAR